MSFPRLSIRSTNRQHGGDRRIGRIDAPGRRCRFIARRCSLELYPISAVVSGIGLNITVMSYSNDGRRRRPRRRSMAARCHPARRASPSSLR